MVKKRSDRWAVLIGINGYHESLGPLKYSVNDCRRLAEVLTTGDDAFPADHVLVLADDEPAERRPTYANIHSWLASWLAQPDEDDTVLIFFAGHGRYEDGKCYLVPGDATLQTIHVTGIPVPYIQELLNRCKARQKVLILDACHSGAGRDVSTMAEPMMDTLSAGKGIYTLTSCDVDEVSHEWDEKAQGVFSYYLAEALSGSCPPDAHGRITAETVYDWTFDSVRTWAAQHRCSQSPKRFSAGVGSLVLHAGVARQGSAPYASGQQSEAACPVNDGAAQPKPSDTGKHATHPSRFHGANQTPIRMQHMEPVPPNRFLFAPVVDRNRLHVMEEGFVGPAMRTYATHASHSNTVYWELSGGTVRHVVPGGERADYADAAYKSDYDGSGDRGHREYMSRSCRWVIPGPGLGRPVRHSGPAAGGLGWPQRQNQ